MRIYAWIARPAGFAAAIVAAVLLLAMLGGAVAPPEADAAKRKRAQRSVLFVGNNWDGTADVVDPRGEFERLDRLNIIPDLEERMAEIITDPVRLGYFLAIRELIGEGHDQFVDDMFTSNDGRLSDRLAAELRRRRRDRPRQTARSSGASSSTASAPTTWRSRPTARTSRSRPRPATSSTCSTPRTGEESGSFESGDSPHENNYSEDGRADLPRQHRPGLHAGRRTRGWTRPRATASSRSSTRRRHRDHQADRHGPEARRGRLSRT